MLKNISAPLTARDIVPAIINDISTLPPQGKSNWRFLNWKGGLSRLPLSKDIVAENLPWKKLLLRCIWPVFLSDAWRISPKHYGERKYPLEPSATWIKRLMSILKPGVPSAFRGLSLCYRWSPGSCPAPPLLPIVRKHPTGRASAWTAICTRTGAILQGLWPVLLPHTGRKHRSSAGWHFKGFIFRHWPGNPSMAPASHWRRWWRQYKGTATHGTIGEAFSSGKCTRICTCWTCHLLLRC